MAWKLAQDSVIRKPCNDYNNFGLQKNYNSCPKRNAIISVSTDLFSISFNISKEVVKIPTGLKFEISFFLELP